MNPSLPAASTVAVFVVAAIVLVAIPGPNMLFILGRGLDQGPRAAFAAAIGVELGTLVHVLGTVVGLSALIAASPVAFTVIKYAGAGYLFYLAVRVLRSRPAPAAEAVREHHVRLTRLAGEAAMVNILNPKVALFFLALLPQYVDPDRGSIGSQTLALGLLFFGIALIMDLAYATLSVPLGRWQRTSSTVATVQRYVSCTTFLALGLYAVFAGPAG
ncbi:MAG: LysE family translocator [Pseudonocardiaceae bacterium]